MVGGDAPQQGLVVAALAHGLGGGPHVGLEAGADAGLFGLVHQADLA